MVPAYIALTQLNMHMKSILDVLVSHTLNINTTHFSYINWFNFLVKKLIITRVLKVTFLVAIFIAIVVYLNITKRSTKYLFIKAFWKRIFLFDYKFLEKYLWRRSNLLAKVAHFRYQTNFFASILTRSFNKIFINEI